MLQLTTGQTPLSLLTPIPIPVGAVHTIQTSCFATIESKAVPSAGVPSKHLLDTVRVSSISATPRSHIQHLSLRSTLFCEVYYMIRSFVLLYVQCFVKVMRSLCSSKVKKNVFFALNRRSRSMCRTANTLDSIRRPSLQNATQHKGWAWGR